MWFYEVATEFGEINIMKIIANTQAGNAVWLVDENGTKIDRVRWYDTDTKEAAIQLVNSVGKPIIQNRLPLTVIVKCETAKLVPSPETDMRMIQILGLRDYVEIV